MRAHGYFVRHVYICLAGEMDLASALGLMFGRTGRGDKEEEERILGPYCISHERATVHGRRDGEIQILGTQAGTLACCCYQYGTCRNGKGSINWHINKSRRAGGHAPVERSAAYAPMWVLWRDSQRHPRTRTDYRSIGLRRHRDLRCLGGAHDASINRRTAAVLARPLSKLPLPTTAYRT
jgi:hypothetical protein